MTTARHPLLLHRVLVALGSGLLFACAMVVMPAAAQDDGEDPLRSDRHLPYRFADVTNYPYLDLTDRGWNRRGVVWDHDADGADDLITLTARGATLRLGRGSGTVQIWEEPLPVEFSRQGSMAGIEGVWAFADPDRPEAVVKASTPDRSRWRFERLRADDGHLVTAFEVAGGEDRRQDGTWDGQFKVLGVENVPTASGPVQALILLVEAGHDLQPRGVMAVAADTGRKIWEYRTGPKPRPDLAGLFDLDGDGTREIVFAGSAVGNLHGAAFNGTSDDTSRVFVLDIAGRQRWSWPGGAYPGNAFFVVLDLDADGRLEMVVAEQGHRSDHNRLWLLNADGTARHSLPVGSGVRDFALLGSTATGAELVLTQLDGTVAVVGVTPEEMELRRSVSVAATPFLCGVVDCLPEEGAEIFLRTADRAVWVLDSRLKPLARLEGQGSAAAAHEVCALHDGVGSEFLVAAGSPEGPGQRFLLEPNPRPVPWGAFVGMVGAGGVATALARRRRFRPSRATRRELRLQLLERLMLSNHGAIGALSALRRLLWNLDAVLEGYAMDDGRRRVLLGLARDIGDTQLPDLEAAVELARLAEPNDAAADRAAEALEALKRRLQPIAAGGLDGIDPATVADLRAAGEGAEQAFHALRRGIEAAFRADPDRIVTQCLAAQRERLGADGVAVAAGLDGWPPCCMDAEELAFVLDNLVENAVRALAGSPDPRLEITGEMSGRHFVIRVRDTGYGIAPDDWERIFEIGESGREGGGLGLPRSRQVLRKYGGKLAVATSRAGGGTTMELTLPVNPATVEGPTP